MKDMKNVIQEYFDQKGWEYKESGNEQFLVRACPLCGADRNHHFYIGMYTGMWDCKACGEKGNFNQLRKKLGDDYIDLTPYTEATVKTKQVKTYRTPKFDLPIQYASRLWMDSKKHAQKYLLETRGLTKKVIEDFKIGLTDRGDFAIPIYDGGKLVNIRYRYSDANVKGNQRYTQEKGCKSPLFNVDAIKNAPARVYITEGEFDAMHLVQRGFHNTVSTTLGASSFPDRWVERFEGVKEIYFVYDTDEEGKSGAKKAAEKLGFERCKLVKLPNIEGKKKTDITDYFTELGGTKEGFLKLVEQAESFTPQAGEEVKHIADFNEELRKTLLEGQHFGISSGYRKLDQAVGGLRKGRVVILSGLTSTGKSSFASNICLNLAHKDEPSFYFSLEMPPIDIAKKILQLKAKLSSKSLEDVEDPSPELDSIDKTLSAFSDLPIYLYAGQGVVKYDVLERTVRYAVETYGVKCIFVDHLNYFSSDYRLVTAETSKHVRQIKQLAMDLQVPIVLLAHLNRGGRAKQRKGIYTPSLADLKDSSTIEQDADQVLFVCRDSENEDDAEKEKAFIKVAKNRDGRSGDRIDMTFSLDCMTFIELQSSQYSQEADEAKKRSEEEQAELATEDIPF